MRVLHSAALLRPPAGILKQMEWEQDAATQNELPWDVRMYCPQGATTEARTVVFSPLVKARSTSKIEKARNWANLRRGYHQWLLQQQDNYDVLLLRYYVHDPYQLAFMRRVKRPVFLVNHTLEVPELRLGGGVGGLIRATLERTLGPYSLRRATGVIAVTDEIAAYETSRARLSIEKSIIYPNGVMYGPEADDQRGVVPEILFVASGFALWHGLDLLVESVRASKHRFTLHIVGDANPELVDRVTSDNRVVFHGRLGQSAIAQLAARCHVALSSFALFRKGMEQACTLKVREYLMLGIPVYSGHRDVLPADFPYYCQGPCDVSFILEYVEKVRGVGRAEVANSAKSLINKRILLGKLYRQLEMQVVL